MDLLSLTMKTRFLHLINTLEILGKSLSNKNCAKKILISMCKVCLPKVTAIMELHELKNLDVLTFFEKLNERENDLKSLVVRNVNANKEKVK